ncbi:MAG TPA: cellulose binding domain-containing protein, partial [bacterium]|nr:cellulose binding domain-containing protein [bacterium]
VPVTATATPTWTPTPLPPTATPTPAGLGSLSVYFMPGVGTDNTNSPHPQIEVVNTGTGPLSLNNVEVRYWFNCDCTGQSVQSWVDWAGLLPGGSSVTGDVRTSVQPTGLGGQTNYVSYQFTGNLVLQPGQRIEIQSRFNKSDWSNMVQDNDWSFTTGSGFTASTHITAYLNGSLVWGQEPASPSPALQAVNLVAFPNVSNGSGVNLSVNLPGTTAGASAKAVTIGSQPIDPTAVITFRAYTLDGQLVWTKTVAAAELGSSGRRGLFWNEKNMASQALSSGLYIVTATVTAQGQTSTASTKVAIVK